MVALALAMALSGLFFFSLSLFLVLAHWMLAMAPIKTLFLGLILCLLPLTPCQTMLYWPHTMPWWPIMVALAVATAISSLFFLSLILFPILAR